MVCSHDVLNDDHNSDTGNLYKGELNNKEGNPGETRCLAGTNIPTCSRTGFSGGPPGTKSNHVNIRTKNVPISGCTELIVLTFVWKVAEGLL